MTKEEKMTLDANTKELKNVNSRLDRILRQIQIANVLKAKELGVDLNEIILLNDKYEDNLKQHAVAIITKKINKEENGNA